MKDQVYILFAEDKDGIEDIVAVYGDAETAEAMKEQRNRVGTNKYKVRAYDIR